MSQNTKFSSRLGFIAAAASSAVGLGSIWRFPYEAGQCGGGLFLLLYASFTLLLGLPLLMTEVAFGRNRHGGTHKAFLGTGPWRLIGAGGALLALIYVSFYNVIIGWVLGYAWKLVSGELLSQTNFAQYFTHFTAHVPSNLLYTALVTLIVAWIIRAGVEDGIEQYSKILMPLFIVLLLGLIGYVLTLSHAGEGVAFYLTPRWQALTPKAIYKALSSAFMTLSIGQGILTTYGAYLRKKDNLVQSALIVVMGVLLMSFLAGLLVFPLVFHQGIAPTAGPGLVFVALPLVFKSLGNNMGLLVGGLFFVLLLFAAFTSSLSLLEVVTNHVMERWGWSRQRAISWIGVLSLVLSVPSVLAHGGHAALTHFWIHKGQVHSFMDTLSLVILDVGIALIALLLCLFLARRWQAYGLTEELQHGTLPYPRLIRYTYLVTRYVAPVVIGGVLVQVLWTLWG